MPANIHDDLFAAEAIRDPYGYFGALRAEAPVHWNEQYQMWVVTSYDRLVWTARHPEYFSSEVALRDNKPPSPTIPEEDMELFGAVRNWMAARFTQNDGAKHKEKRKVVHGFFTPRAMETWRPLVRQTVNDLLDDLQGAGRMDVMHDFATPLTYSIIAGLMDIPPSDRAFVKELCGRMCGFDGNQPDRIRMYAEGVQAVTDYLAPIVAQRVRDPGDDLLSVICKGEIMGAYTRDEVLANALLLLVAGHETTNDLISNGVLAFAQHSDQFDLLRTDPDAHIVNAVEEVLRYDSPLKSIQRVATQDVDMGDGQRWARTTASGGSSRQPIETPRYSRSRTPWISRATRIPTLPSAAGFTTAWGRPWRGWKGRKPSPNWPAGSRGLNWKPIPTSWNTCPAWGSAPC